MSSRPLSVSAITFHVVRFSEMVSVATCRTRPGVAFISSPVAKLAPTTGMVTTGPPRVPRTTSVRPGWPSLKITTALALAAWALAALTPNVQVPRWMTATFPSGKPAKSSSSQPLVELGVGSGGIWTSTRVAGAVTSPEPENVKLDVS